MLKNNPKKRRSSIIEETENHRKKSFTFSGQKYKISSGPNNNNENLERFHHQDLEGYHEFETFRTPPNRTVQRTASDEYLVGKLNSSDTKLLSETSGSFRYYPRRSLPFELSNENTENDLTLNLSHTTITSASMPTYKAFSDFGDISFSGTLGSLPPGYQDINGDDQFETSVLTNNTLNAPLFTNNGNDPKTPNTLDLADLGLGSIGSFDKRSRSPYSLTGLSRGSVELQSRSHWKYNMQFVSAVLSLGFGLRSLIDVPMTIFNHGRGTFVTIYLLLMFFVLAPLIELFSFLGQYFQGGPLVVLSSSPVAFGIGIAMTVGCFLLNLYNGINMTHSLFYLYHSFFQVTPWSFCQPVWGAQSDCEDFVEQKLVENSSSKSFLFLQNLYVKGNGNSNKNGICSENEFSCQAILQQPTLKTPSFQFWTFCVNDNSTSLNWTYDNWDISLLSSTPWLFVFFSLFQSVRSYKNLVLPLALIPLILLTSLLIRSVTLVSPDKPLELFEMNLNDFSNLNTWAMAGKCAFSDSLLLTGSLISLASFQSYSDRKNHFNGFLIVLILFLFQIASYVFLVEILHYNKATDLLSRDFSMSDIAFGIMPGLLNTLDLPQLWTSIFFGLILLIEFGTALALSEAFLSSMEDYFTRFRHFRLFSSATFATCMFLFSLPFFTNQGKVMQEAFRLFLEPYLTECVTIACLMFTFIYGVGRLSADFYRMTGMEISKKFVGLFLLFVSVTFVSVSISFHFKEVARNSSSNLLPVWAKGLGTFVLLAVVLQIPLYPLYLICRSEFRRTSSLSEIFSVRIKKGPRALKTGSNMIFVRSFSFSQPRSVKTAVELKGFKQDQ